MSQSNTHNLHLAGDMSFPVRIAAVFFARGQAITEGDRLYTLEDGTGASVDVAAQVSGTVTSEPFTVGTTLSGPAVVAQIDRSEARAARALEDFLREPVNTDKHQTQRQYRAAAMNVLMRQGIDIEDARAAVDGPALEARWTEATKPVFAPRPAPEPEPEPEPEPVVQPEPPRPQPQPQPRPEPLNSAQATTEAPPQQDTTRAAERDLRPAPTSYGAALLAPVVAALAGVGYAYAVVYIPLIFIGYLIGFGLAWAAVFIVLLPLTGPLLFRVATCALTGAALIYAHWATILSLRFELPLWDVVTYPTLFAGGMAALGSATFEYGDFTSSGGLPISGGFLWALWALEALLLLAAPLVAFLAARDDQTIDAAADRKRQANAVRAHLLPTVAGLLIGFVKGLLPIALVFGGVYLLSEYVF